MGVEVSTHNDLFNWTGVLNICQDSLLLKRQSFLLHIQFTEKQVTTLNAALALSFNEFKFAKCGICTMWLSVMRMWLHSLSTAKA